MAIRGVLAPRGKGTYTGKVDVGVDDVPKNLTTRPDGNRDVDVVETVWKEIRNDDEWTSSTDGGVNAH